MTFPGETGDWRGHGTVMVRSFHVSLRDCILWSPPLLKKSAPNKGGGIRQNWSRSDNPKNPDFSCIFGGHFSNFPGAFGAIWAFFYQNAPKKNFGACFHEKLNPQKFFLGACSSREGGNTTRWVAVFPRVITRGGYDKRGDYDKNRPCNTIFSEISRFHDKRGVSFFTRAMAHIEQLWSLLCAELS